MKKLSLILPLLACLVYFGNMAQAQYNYSISAYYAPGIPLERFSGPEYSQWKGEWSQAELRMVNNFGIYGSWEVKPTFIMTTGLGYIQWHETETKTEDFRLGSSLVLTEEKTVTFDLYYDYISIPLEGRYQFNFNRVSVGGHLGLQTDLRTRLKTKQDPVIENPWDSALLNFRSYLTRFGNATMAFRGGVDWRYRILPRWNFYNSVTYHHQIISTREFEPEISVSQFNHYLSIECGVEFIIPSKSVRDPEEEPEEN